MRMEMDDNYLRGTQGAVHKLVASTAKEIAAAEYERFASKSNTFFAQYKDQDEWVRKGWRYFVVAARTTLAKLLETNMDENLKEEIADALIKDNSLRRGDTMKVQVRND